MNDHLARPVAAVRWERNDRRMVAQGIVWTLKLPVPAEGLDVQIADDDLKLPER